MLAATSQDVASLHTNIARAVRDVTGARLQVVSTSHPNPPNVWESVPSETTVRFGLDTIRGDDPRVLTDHVDRERGERSFVFRLIEQNEEEPTLWAGWFEQWKTNKERVKRFDLIAMSWTFYWGVYLRPRQGLLRADWDALSARSQGAAQPHWHIDSKLLLVTYRRLPSQAAASAEAVDSLVEFPPAFEGLEELTNDCAGLQQVSLSGMHLGMGGWTHSTSHPNCWRLAIPVGWQDITTWVKRTLTSARDQFVEQFRPEPPEY